MLNDQVDFAFKYDNKISINIEIKYNENTNSHISNTHKLQIFRYTVIERYIDTLSHIDIERDIQT